MAASPSSIKIPLPSSDCQNFLTVVRVFQEGERRKCPLLLLSVTKIVRGTHGVASRVNKTDVKTFATTSGVNETAAAGMSTVRGTGGCGGIFSLSSISYLEHRYLGEMKTGHD
ncbi:hypothetical protein Fot_35329 [Forsythia ovata]|uniref:Uncharacterized protein n=1 Tax=Forsythia ovata TaxID=205694 RepID=A0ABD1SLW9_9LAMI